MAKSNIVDDDGEVLESGYPRNDALHACDRDEVRARVRQELRIADRQTAVLYTPTWRDDVVFSEGGKTFALELDVAQFADRLGSDHVLLLRLHRMLGAQGIAAAYRRATRGSPTGSAGSKTGTRRTA
jgi:CDP-glycerol glycerophosphotransferase (TagB/SpsB family)